MDAARLSFSVLTALALLVATNAPARACGAEAFGTGRVAAIEDRQTFRLGDGRRFRLAGVEWAVPPDRARAALAHGLLDRTVALSGFDKAADRHGRLHAFPIVSGSETPIQYALLEQGLALVNGQIADGTCRETLLRLERAARAAGRGGWAENGSARLHDAGKPAGILKDRGRFGIVQGRVLSVREAGNTIYVNFGRRWSEDFTATIAKRHHPAFISAGLLPRSLAGRTVRIRGIIEERAGPWIEATTPGQFEIVAGE
jgi:endonuclease YncB( thermonuclease family)